MEADIPGLLDEFRVLGGVTFTRRTPGAPDARGKVSVTTVPVLVDPVVISPLSSKQLARLSDSDRARGNVMICTTTRMHVTGSGELPDRFDWQGSTYELAAEEDFEQEGGFTYRATRVEVRA